MITEEDADPKELEEAAEATEGIEEGDDDDDDNNKEDDEEDNDEVTFFLVFLGMPVGAAAGFNGSTSHSKVSAGGTSGFCLSNK